MKTQWVRLFVMLLMFLVAAVGTRSRLRARRGGGTVSHAEEGPILYLLIRLCGLALVSHLFAFVVRPSLVAPLRVDVPAPLQRAGLASAFLSVGLLAWMFRALGLNLTNTVVVRDHATLVTNGPYRWIRHPFYSFSLLLVASLALLTGLWPVAMLGVATFALLAYRSRREEQALLNRFGADYQSYRSRTGAFVPKLSRGG